MILEPELFVGVFMFKMIEQLSLDLYEKLKEVDEHKFATFDQSCKASTSVNFFYFFSILFLFFLAHNNEWTYKMKLFIQLSIRA